MFVYQCFPQKRTDAWDFLGSQSYFRLAGYGDSWLTYVCCLSGMPSNFLVVILRKIKAILDKGLLTTMIPQPQPLSKAGYFLGGKRRSIGPPWFNFGHWAKSEGHGV